MEWSQNLSKYHCEDGAVQVIVTYWLGMGGTLQEISQSPSES